MFSSIEFSFEEYDFAAGKTFGVTIAKISCKIN